MPLIIGEVDARIEIEPARPAPPAAPGVAEAASAEAARARAIAAERFERELRVEQRDPDRLGGR